jgi:serine/threonine protein kinase
MSAAMTNSPAPPTGGAEEQLPKQFGKYTLMRRLAAGGMAELFLSLHKSVAGFEKLIVIKRILPAMNQDKAFIDMLLHEARVAATLSHPNIVQTFDVGQVDGTYFIAMEHIHGEDIRSIVRGMKRAMVLEFPVEHALAICIGTCAGLAYAHEKRDLNGQSLSIVHRDISPQNIVVTFEGDVKVVDFGIAKSQHVVEDRSPGQLKGKVPYMSPEQAAGEEIDWRSDIFAVGVILFELTTGKRLFKGQNEYETLKLICEREYPRPSQVRPGYPLGLERIVMRALEKRRENRYQSAREMQSDLEAFVREERLKVSPVSVSEWMRMLFRDKLAQQQELLNDVKRLADVLADQHQQQTAWAAGMTGEWGAVNLQNLTAATGVNSVSAPGTSPGTSSTVPPPRRSSLPMILAAVGALFLGGGAVFFLTRTPPEPKPGPAVSDPAKVAAKELRGSLVVETTPPDATIWIAGEMRKESSPATIENLPLDTEIELKVSKDGFESYREKLTLTTTGEGDARKGESRTVKVEMKKGSVTVVLEVEPTPQVWVDGKAWNGDVKKVEGISADEEHKIAVAAAGYVAKTFTFKAKQGETLTFKHVLVKADPRVPTPGPRDAGPKDDGKGKGGTGTVRVGAKGGFCNVSVNGAALGPTPTQTTVPAGTARVTCTPEGGSPMTQSVQVEAGGTARVGFVIP